MDFTHFEKIFATEVKGKQFSSGNHAGSLGHWLEQQCGVKPNSIPGADLEGFEIKSGITKGSFGDWSADWYIYHGDDIENRDSFLEIFGTKKRPDRPNRYSWTSADHGGFHSDKYTSVGQRIRISGSNQIVVQYNFAKDQRANKASIVPSKLQKGNHTIARWSETKLGGLVDAKFGQKGWVLFSVVSKNGIKQIDSLYLGKAFDYNFWLNEFRCGNIEFDSGMYTGNPRPYQQFRAKKAWWHQNSFKQIT